jgi:acetylglutamate kinase
MDKNDPLSLIKEMNLETAKGLESKGIIQGGMIPKTDCCIKAIENGVKEAIILNGLKEHSLLLETFTNEGSGTLIKN